MLPHLAVYGDLKFFYNWGSHVTSLTEKTLLGRKKKTDRYRREEHVRYFMEHIFTVKKNTKY